MLGPFFMDRACSDLKYTYAKVGSGVMDYLYHCIAQWPRYAFLNELYKITFFVHLLEYTFSSE